MCFNDEQVARAVASCPVPVVTGIGHEPDTSIADMVADRRCSTPTAAAESVAPAIDEVERQMIQRQARLGRAMSSMLERSCDSLESLARLAENAVVSSLASRRAAVEAFAARPCLTDPAAGLRSSAAELEQTAERLHTAVPRLLARKQVDCERDARRMAAIGPRLLRAPESEVGRLAATLDALSPLKVLGRGYSITRDARGHVLKEASGACVGDAIEVQLGSGSLRADVVEVNPH